MAQPGFSVLKRRSDEVLEKLDTALYKLFQKYLKRWLYCRYTQIGLRCSWRRWARLKPFSPVIQFGNDYFVKATNLVKQLTAGETIITGEGRYDEQSSMGKITGTVIDLCHQYKKKCIVLCGSSSTRSNAAFELITLCNESEINDCIVEPKLYLENTLKRIFIK